MGRLEGKTALVTGASRGIGRAIAIELAREGAKVAVNYQSNDAKAQEVADEIAKLGGAAMLVKANLANPQEARAMVKQSPKVRPPRHPGQQRRHHPRCDAPQNDRRELDRGDSDQPECLFLLHFGRHPDHDRAKLRADRQHQLDERPDGRPWPGQLQRQQGRHHRLHPDRGPGAGQVRHHRQQRLAGIHRDRHVRQGAGDIQAQIKAKIPLGRFAQPEEIAKAVIFLVADGDYITGQQINVNGGAFMM